MDPCNAETPLTSVRLLPLKMAAVGTKLTCRAVQRMSADKGQNGLGGDIASGQFSPGTGVAGQFCQTINFLNVSNIDQQLWTLEIMLAPSPPPVIESFALPPDLKVECNDRLPSRNPAARNSETPLREMPNAHDACVHLAGACRIRA